MPDWVKRVTKDRPQDFGPGEVVVAATYFQGRGSAGGQIRFGAAHGVIGGAVGMQVGARAREAHLSQAKDGYNTFEGSIASLVPARAGILAVTQGRLVVFPYSQGMLKTKVEDPVASIAYQDLTGWSFRRGTLVSVLNLAFSDGSDVGIEIPKVNRPDAFANTLGIPRLD